jgi:acyl-CoA synthetase (AMP-forming)/AMP-acid ligase II
MEFTVAGLIEATAEAVPTRPAILTATRHVTFVEFLDRSTRLARFLSDRGMGLQRERSSLLGHQSGQDFLAQYLYNSPEYLEGLVGSLRGRLVPMNVNYRYVARELRYVLSDARPAAIQYHARLAPVLRDVLQDIDFVRVLLQVDDGSGEPLLPGAIDYEEALSSVPSQVDAEMSPDDLYAIYTGGTTGMPKGVLWRQGDIVVAGLGVRNRRDDRDWTSSEERMGALGRRPHRVLPLAPFMHGAAQWIALQAICEGHGVVIPPTVGGFDADETWDCVAREQVTMMSIVGDAFARPLADALESRPRQLPSLQYLFSGGAALSPIHKRRLMDALPGVQVIETIGSSETGTQGRLRGVGEGSAPVAFERLESTVVLSEDFGRLLSPGDAEVGWLAKSGRVPLGYLGDAEKTRSTFPLVSGTRYCVPGDRARLLPGGEVELLGRDGLTINSGGEKVFVEEVEAAIKAHTGVADVVVCGRLSERWGSEVVAIVEPRVGATLDRTDIAVACSERIARYKIPKVVLFVERISRTPAGKADYRWASDVIAHSDQDATNDEPAGIA